ncbi:SpoIIE family protein phosphatase [Paenibacillus sp. TRM 82003]|uniref:GAF domain-containing SpoIIE family protein phosphatase n=1 Tax=Kineococcus sp. TRM81007 TaxID=2925831 RepID=UPI001F59BAA6|nr:GAF domain-containing SpoIIE family protein phosphatase [Kineococcus sp. TRM81007]MCI2238065.1 SpoIIE family protein phosphatase [Kineococcus sp. TRM81007]MCI3926079.1 SpoIIE family protein phosphatase [Paenibacillus sp. TRM 82003]
MDGTHAAFANDAVTDSLPSVIHTQPGAVLLVRVTDGTVLFANPLAEELAPGLSLPCAVDDWSRAAGLQASDGSDLADPDSGEAASPLSRIAHGEPVRGERVSAARGSAMATAREALWVVGLPLTDAPVEELTTLALVVLLPLREKALVDGARESAEQLHSRAVIASDLSFTISDPDQPDNPLVWVNPAFERVTGYGREVLGTNCRFLQGPDTDREAVHRISKALREGETVTELLLNYRKDGTAFWNEVVISPVRDAAGKVTHHVGVQSDVTLRVQAERERDAALAVARDARRRLEFLSSVADELSAVLDPDTAQDMLPSLVVPAFAEWAFATVLDTAGRTRHVRAAHANPARAADAERFARMQANLLETSVSVRVLQGRQGPTLLRVTDRDLARGTGDPETAALLRRLGLGSAVVVPLRARGQVTGALTLLSGPDRPPYTEDDLLTASDLGARAGVALENARLYAQQRRSSETLQRSLLTPPRDTPGLEVATRYLPAAEAAQVGGDWYDAFTQPDGCTTVVIGDVMGHDVSAAAAMGQLRTMVRTLAHDRSAAPREVLQRLDALLEGLGVTTLATAVVLQLDARSTPGHRGIRWCTAGHLPPVVAAPDGTVSELDGEGLIIGLGAHRDRVQREAQLALGSTVLLYTDGLVERRDRPMEARLAELRDAVADLAGAPLEELCDQLVRRMLPDGSDDDVAIAAVRVLAR